MNNTAAISLLVMVCMFGSLECNTNKTELVIGQLGSEKDTCLGTQFALNVSKNSSAFKAFLETYEITLHCMPKAYNSPSNAILYAIFLLKNRNGSKPLVVLGPDFAEEATGVLNVVRYFRKLMVTIVTTANKLQELKDPYGFTFKETAYSFNPAKVEIMKHFGWQRAAVVYDFLQHGAFYVKVVEDLADVFKKQLPSKNVDLTFEPINTNAGTELVKGSVFDVIRKSLQKLKDLDYKIFFGEFNERGASLVFCELFKMGMYGPEYVWILNPEAKTVDEWVNEAKKNKKKLTKTCTKEQYQVAVNRSFLLQGGMAKAFVDYETSSGLTTIQAFEKLGMNITKNTRKDKIKAAFDAMWGTMLAMKEASKELSTTPNGTYSLENNNGPLGVDSVTKLLVEKLKNVSFDGLTGPVSFTKDKRRKAVIVLKQYQDGGTKLVEVGEYSRREEKIQFYNGTEKCLWKGCRIPSDSTRREEVPADIPAALFIIFSTVASFGIVLGIVFLVFNRYYRKYKFIRLSAPMFNDVMVLGCIMCLATVYLFGYRNSEDPEVTMPRICKARAWILNIGFSLAFGAMFIKTWRIYKICTNKRLKVRLGPLSDWWMLAMVGGIVVIDVAILVAWEVTDPLQHDKVNLTDKEDPDKPYVIIVSTLNTCTAKNLEIWLTLIYVYKGILLLYGLFLAYETRNVVYAHLNDSRVIGICVYNVVVLSMIGAFLALILNDQQFKQLYAALSVCISFPATATISLIFIPKLVHRIKASSLDDETLETTMNSTFARPSIDITNTCQGTEMGRERLVDAPPMTTLGVYQNGGYSDSLSPIPSPTPPKTIEEPVSPAKTLED